MPLLARDVDRKTTELSPVEHGVLLIGAYEFQHCLDIPYRVAINEASSWPRASAAPMATSTSTACSTRRPPTCARPRWQAAPRSARAERR